MNKRQNKKKIKYIIDNIQKLTLNENDMLIFKVNINKIKPNVAMKFAEFISEQIPDHKFILIPTGSNLSKKKESL